MGYIWAFFDPVYLNGYTGSFYLQNKKGDEEIGNRIGRRIVFAGIVLIVKGGDSFVDAAPWMAEASGIPKLIVGATVVSLATTLP